MTQDAPAYLKIRADEEAGVIRAWIAMTDGSMEVEISTLSINLASEDKELFDDWKFTLARAHQ